MALVECECVVQPDQAGRLDQVVKVLTERSWSDVRGLIHHGGVRVNGEICRDASADVRVGDSVKAGHDPRQKYHAPPRERTSSAFRLVYEDEHLLVVDKAAAVLTVPTDRGESNTLLDAVNDYLRRHRQTAGLVHRLDRGTSGLLVFGKSSKIAEELQAQFRVHKAEREYAAIVAGTMSQPTGTFRSRLGMTKSLQRYSVSEEEDGETAVTHFRVERKLKSATFVKAQLETGRRNQIRVHFSEAGHPVLGDERYRADLAIHPGWRARRLALHAAVLGFDHPRTGKPLRFESALPDEFQQFLARWS